MTRSVKNAVMRINRIEEEEIGTEEIRTRSQIVMSRNLSLIFTEIRLSEAVRTLMQWLKQKKRSHYVIVFV